MARLQISVALLCASALAAHVAQATVIDYSVTNIAGSTWRYDYSVTNDTLNMPLSEFTIYFDRVLYTNLTALNSPLQWSPLVAQPDPNLPADGFYDALALDSGLGQGGSIAGFSVAFDWLGQQTPGSQPFDVVDSSVAPVLVLDSGQTQLGTSPTSVPEPDALSLMALGAAACVALSARRWWFRGAHR
jgi:hypothetical protein